MGMGSSLLFLAFLCLGMDASLALEQFTPVKADWSTFYSKAAHLTDHSPDGIDWLDSSNWEEWDGKIIDPSQYSKAAFAKLICPTGDKVRGIRTLFYKHNPFANLKKPTKAEVDEWHRLALNHVRAMVGYIAAEYQIQPHKCLHLRALWSDERHRSRMWDAKYEGTCEGSTNPHCGASFIPSAEDQQPYLPADIASCVKTAGSEGIFSAAKANIPWSIKWSRPFCHTLGAEGFWGGHTGPWFHRSQFGWSWWDGDKDNSNSNAILRAKWSGASGASLYVNPEITSGKFLVNWKEPRFPGFECEGRVWGASAATATDCYEQMLADSTCGHRFMTFNNGGCACYPVDMTTCVPKTVSGRLTWDFESVPSSFNGYYLLDKPLHSGKRCQDIIWKYTAGDASHCLEKLMMEADPACGKTYMTWNSANGGCACYPPEQNTCDTKRESGRQTYELQFDLAYITTSDPASPSNERVPASTSNERVQEAEGMAIKILGQSGKLSAYKKAQGPSDPSKVMIEMDALREVDASGNQVGKAGSTKHSIDNFASQSFTSYSPQAVTMGQDNAVSAWKMNAESIVSTVGTIGVDTYIMTSAGVVGPEGEPWPVVAGDIKFNIAFSKWTFCDTQICTDGVGDGVEVDVKIKGSKAIAVSAPGMEQIFDLGGGVALQLTRKIMVDGVQVEMPAGYPKVRMSDNLQVFTFRFPKFTSTALYDPLLTFREGGVVASQAAGFTGSMFSCVFAALLSTFAARL